MSSRDSSRPDGNGWQDDSNGWQDGWQDGWQQGWQNSGQQGSSRWNNTDDADVQWRDVPSGFDPQQTRDHRDILRFMYQVSAKGRGKTFQEWTRQWREARRMSERTMANAKEGHWQTSDGAEGRKWRWMPRPTTWRQNEGRSRATWSTAEAVERAEELTMEVKGKGKADDQAQRPGKRGNEAVQEALSEIKGQGKGKGKDVQEALAKFKGHGKGKDGRRPINVVQPNPKEVPKAKAVAKEKGDGTKPEPDAPVKVTETKSESKGGGEASEAAPEPKPAEPAEAPEAKPAEAPVAKPAEAPEPKPAEASRSSA